MTFTQLSTESAAARLLSLVDPLVIVHTRPDGDAIGSAAALCHVLSALGKRPILCSPDKIPVRLSFLLDGIELAPCGQLPSERDDVITVDVASPSQLGAFEHSFGERRTPSLQIDHHEKGTAFADCLIIPHAAATGEVLFNLFSFLEEQKKIPALTTKALSCLYAAISSDTGGFRFSNTTPETHRIAAILLSRGVNSAEINRLLFSSHTEEELRAKAFVLSKFKTECDGQISHVEISIKEREEKNLPEDAFDTAIDVVRSLSGVRIAACLKEISSGRFKVSLRATAVSVADIAAFFGGGGHKLAAGCTICAKTADEAWQIIFPHLQKALSNS